MESKLLTSLKELDGYMMNATTPRLRIPFPIHVFTECHTEIWMPYRELQERMATLR